MNVSIAGTSQSSITSAVHFDDTKTQGSLRVGKQSTVENQKHVMFADQDSILNDLQN